MPDVRSAFRLMVHGHPTGCPLVVRNPQAFVEHINTANEANFKRETHTVHPR